MYQLSLYLRGIYVIRVFISFDLDEATLLKIADIQSKLKRTGIKLVELTNIHITLKFLGDIEDSKTSEIIDKLNNVNCPPFSALLNGIGLFPNIKTPRIIWINAEGDFSCLHKQIEKLMSNLGFVLDERVFIPHITIARVLSLTDVRKKELMSIIYLLKIINLGTININHLKLKKSTLTSQGPIYETIHEVRLK